MGQGLAQVSHLWFGFGKFPLKIPNFAIFSPIPVKKNLFGSGQKVPWAKDRSAFYLLWLKSMLRSGPISSLR